jgi:hypothetical protein
MIARQEGYEIMPDEIQALTARMDKLQEAMTLMQGDVRVIKTLVETEGQRCAYRERIDQAVALIPRIVSLENRLVSLEVKVAGIAVVSAVVTAVITSLATGAFKP